MATRGATPRAKNPAPLLTVNSRIKPIERCEHSTVVYGDKLYLWGGRFEGLPQFHSNASKMACLSNIDVLDLCTGQWESLPTRGQPHLGVVGYAYGTLGNRIVFFGGYCGHHSCYHNGVTELNVDTLTWSTRMPTSSGGSGPIKKAHCGAAVLSDKKQDYLFVTGGEGLTGFHMETTQTVTNTNEQHLFKLATGTWTTPGVSGKCPPPLSWFTCNKMADNSAILYGGRSSDGLNSDVYIAKLASEKMRWEKIEPKYKNVGKWPRARYSHAAVIVYADTQKKCPFLLITGGVGASDTCCWIMDIKEKTFREVMLPSTAIHRHDHSLSLYVSVSSWPSSINYLVTFGGLRDVKKLNDVVINEIEFDKLIKTWRVNSSPLDDSSYRKRDKSPVRSQSLPGKRSEMEELEATLTAIESMEKDDLISDLQEQVQDKDQVQQEFVQQYRDSIADIQGKMRLIIEENDKLKQEKERVEREKEQILRDKEQVEHERDQLRVQLSKASTDARSSTQSVLLASSGNKMEEDWVVERREISLTQEEIGRGAFGEVKVAKFRGIRVAAKFLHRIIISDYNLHLFTREMEIASRLRHPHLVQFIGATKEEHPIILIELMPTSLSKEIEKAQLSQQAILSVSQDIACALNYLHLMKPNSIIHRDVSSKNVLLEPIASKREWKAKLSDFGSANIQAHTSTQVPGNPCYAAPEAQFPHDHSPAMDVYSFGILCTEMCVRQPPEMTPEARQRQIASVQWSEMKQFVIEKCILKDRHKRPKISAVLERLFSLRPAQ